MSPGIVYKFKVQARNQVGYSDYSSFVSILAAQRPDTPAAPTTVIDNLNVIIDWVAPNEQGSQILGYMIYIRKVDEVTFGVDAQNCEGSMPEIISATQCTVPIATLTGVAF
jgi:hypothetical protein